MTEKSINITIEESADNFLKDMGILDILSNRGYIITSKCTKDTNGEESNYSFSAKRTVYIGNANKFDFVNYNEKEAKYYLCVFDDSYIDSIEALSEDDVTTYVNNECKVSDVKYIESRDIDKCYYNHSVSFTIDLDSNSTFGEHFKTIANSIVYTFVEKK